jgi:hypothetical protein
MNHVQKLIKAMSKVQLNLVVIRSGNIEQAAVFYQRIQLGDDVQSWQTQIDIE